MRFWTNDFFPRGKRCQRRDSEIDSDRALVFGESFGSIFRFDGKTDKPAIGHTGDGGRQDLSGESKGFVHPDPSEKGNPDLPVPDFELVVRESKTVVNAFPVKLRTLASTFKEVPEGVPQLDDRHLRGVLRDFQHPRELFPLEGVELPTESGLRWLGKRGIGLVRLVLPVPLGQRPVVRETGDSARLPEICLLSIVGIEMDLVGNDHSLASSTDFLIPSSSFRFL